MAGRCIGRVIDELEPGQVSGKLKRNIEVRSGLRIEIV